MAANTLTRPALTALEVDTTTALIGALHDASDEELEALRRTMVDAGFASTNTISASVLLTWCVTQEQRRREAPDARWETDDIARSILRVSETMAALADELTESMSD